MKNFGKLAVLGAALAVSATYAFATPIPAATSITSMSSVLQSTINGSVVATLTGSDTVLFLGNPDYTATMVETVIRGGTDSLCTSCLSFEFAITNSATSVKALESVNVASFLLGQTDDIEYVTGGSDPITSASSNADGSVINVYFPNVTGNVFLTPGETDTFLIETNASSYSIGNLGTANSANGNITDFAPAVPEPNSLMLLGTGLIGGAGVLMRRRRSVV